MTKPIETEERLQKVVFAVVDFANAVEAAAVSLRENIRELTKFPEEKPAEIYDKLPWEARQGSRGPFEMVNKKMCDNSDLYRHLFNIVKANTVNTGKFSHSIGGYYYWLDTRDNPTDPTAVYRRPKKGKTPPEPKKEETQVAEIENVRSLFPKNLEDLLSFEATDKHIIAKPRTYLGSENFSKIASIVREAGGEYISAGKESRFRIPRERVPSK